MSNLKIENSDFVFNITDNKREITSQSVSDYIYVESYANCSLMINNLSYDLTLATGQDFYYQDIDLPTETISIFEDDTDKFLYELSLHYEADFLDENKMTVDQFNYLNELAKQDFSRLELLSIYECLNDLINDANIELKQELKK